MESGPIHATAAFWAEVSAPSTAVMWVASAAMATSRARVTSASNAGTSVLP
jgi:hypothetical protein